MKMRLFPALALLVALAATASAETTLRVAMTAGDIPITTGIPDQGSEGVRFVGYSLYDALVLFDLSSADRPANIGPGLARSWKIDPQDPKRWLFTLREGVKWHDGRPFTPEDVVWNFKRILDKTAPQFDPLQFALGRTYAGNVVSVERVDDHTVAINMDRVHSLFPYLLPQIMLISLWNQSKIGGFDMPALVKTARRPGQPSVKAVTSVVSVRPAVSRVRWVR
jgi:peptide/nickel transport system substrate-binding protein